MSVARWLRVDLHAHTPFDRARNWGLNQQRARDKGMATSDGQAHQWLDRCREAELDIVAITDHNTIAGYDEIAAQLPSWSKKSNSDLCVLPGVELSVGGCHFLVVADPSERGWLDRLVGSAFGTREPIRADGKPEEATIGIAELAREIVEAASAGRRVLALPAHVDQNKGLAKTLQGLVRERAFAQRAWSGFQVRGDEFRRSKDLLRMWAAASLFGRLPEELEEGQVRVLDEYVSRDAWPLVDASDPDGYADLGAVFTWLKMSVPGVEGIRQALLDPESRLRRHAQAPPSAPGVWIERIEIEGVEVDATSLFDEKLSIDLSPALNTIIGGRGTGKSTIVEMLRWGLDRHRSDDFSPDEQAIKAQIDKRLSPQGGILGAKSHIRIVLQRDGHGIEVERTLAELGARPLDGTGDLDVRTAIEPRILSQRQISGIAADPRAIRREADQAVATDLASWREQRAAIVRSLEELQGQRRDLRAQLEQRAAVQTEIELLARKIETIERVAKSETLNAHRDIQRQARWLTDLLESLSEVANSIPEEDALLGDDWPTAPPGGPAAEALKALHRTVSQHRQKLEKLRAELYAELVASRQAVVEARDGAFATIREPIVKEYQKLIESLRKEGVELGQLDALHAKHAAAGKRLETLKQLPSQIERLNGEIATLLEKLDRLHDRRRSLREKVATRLKDADADIRLDVSPFGDRRELAEQRERWWGGTGMRTEDWERLVSSVYSDAGDDFEQVPTRWRELIGALRTDHDQLSEQGAAARKVRAFAEGDELSGYVENAVASIDPERFDAMERFLPDDRIGAQFRDRDGQFRSIDRASLGQQNTAVLSLLLTVGDGPLVLDQPEDDLDNRYIYDVVVELLRSTKTRRQIITVTHNANIPVNGDSECIIALDPFLDESTPMLSGTLEVDAMKEAVSNIMEGSEAAFRLRRQRYGY